MLKSITFLSIAMFTLLTISCKNETQESKNSDVENVTTQVPIDTTIRRAAKKDLTPADIALLQSVMARVMNEPHLKRFASYLVTAELTDQLANEGAFTVFGPSNTAVESLTAERTKFYSIQENRAKLEEMLKSHIVVGKMDKETLLQAIGKSGKAKLKTLAGTTLTATKSGEDIVLSDGKSGSAKVTSVGVEGSNGMVYIIDGVLNAN